MSELTISKEQLSAVQSLLSSTDPEAHDPVTYAQYLAAMLGIVVADIAAPEDKLNELLVQLSAFAQHVFTEEREKKKTWTPPGQEAFGIWQPKNTG